MWPLLMLAAQAVSAEEQKRQAHRKELEQLAMQRAQQLGGNTMPAEAAQMNGQIRNANYIGNPEQLTKMYESFKSKPSLAEGANSTTPGSDGLVNPWLNSVPAASSALSAQAGASGGDALAGSAGVADGTDELADAWA